MDEITTTATVRVTTDERKANEWALVLMSAGVPHTIARTFEGFEIAVAPDAAERALSALSAYDDETPLSAPVEEPAKVAPLAQAGMLGPIAILVIQAALRGGWVPRAAEWFARGSSRADRVVAGEWWRAVTALTLHADVGHVVGNAAAGAVFVSLLCRVVGGGVGLLATVVAGALGNLINAAAYRAGHDSIGASTALFGAIGALGVIEFGRRRRGAGSRIDWRKAAWLPIAASMGLLAMLGTGGEHTDQLAHLFGFIAGSALGLPLAWVARRPPSPAVQVVALAAAGGLVAAAWWVALS